MYRTIAKWILAVLFVPTLAHAAGPFLTPVRPQNGLRVSEAEAKLVRRSQPVTVDASQIESGAKTIPLALFNLNVRAILDHTERMGGRQSAVAWFGKISEQPGSSVVLVSRRGIVAGTIATQRGQLFDIRPTGERVHLLRELARERFRDEGKENTIILPKPKGGGDSGGDTCSTDPAGETDIMVVYTPAARAGAGGVDAIETTILLAVANANNSYLNSNINQHLNIVHMEEFNYVETGTIQTDLANVQGDAGVQALRNTFAADLVAMVIESNVNGNWCGWGNIMGTVGNAFESSAYVVVERDCAAGNLSFAHELGHNMGARHDWFVDSTNNSPYAFNHGFVKKAPTSPATPWRTIMAYNNDCSNDGFNCDRLMYWSNPNVNYPPGDAMGTSTGNQADNHQTLNNTALTVANFRCGSPSVSNVWMKDTWNDTGAEPDSHTAGEDMWKSPYIWNRTAQDTNLTQQHMHQNPINGQQNFAYVKLHNGGAATSGDVKLYLANASVSLAWPAGWTLIATVPIASFAAHSTKVIEAAWNPPGAGHYCMVARWVSGADPMTNPEGVDIEHNVRFNNNIVWRNLNIVDMGGDKAEGDATFRVDNLGKREMAVSLYIGPPRRNQRNRSFAADGRIVVRLDDALLKAWAQGGSKGSGFKADGNSFLITQGTGARWDNIIMPAKFRSSAKINFRKLKTTPRRTYVIDAIELLPRSAATNAAGAVVGGVSYEIHTEGNYIAGTTLQGND